MKKDIGGVPYDQNLFKSIRSEFPALRGLEERGIVLCDGAAGSQMHQSAIQAMVESASRRNSNVGGSFSFSSDNLDAFTHARRTMGAFLNCKEEEVVFGSSATALNFHMSRSIGRTLGRGDNVVVTCLDHAANVGPWETMAAEAGAELRRIKVRHQDCALDMDSVRSCIDSRTRLVACSAASNLVGVIPQVQEVVSMARAHGALSYVDAVHLAPHALIDVRQLGCDFLVCSPYKFFGPHLALLFLREGLARSLPAYKIRPATDDLPSFSNCQGSRWEMGTQNYEGIAGAAAAVSYIASLSGRQREEKERSRGTQEPPSEGLSLLRASLRDSYSLISQHESLLSDRFLSGVRSIPAVKVHGPTADQHGRTPTFAISMTGADGQPIPPHVLCESLVEDGIWCSSGNFYALDLTETLGLEEGGGVVRVSFLHYNVLEDVDRVLRSLDKISKRRSAKARTQ
ncbi:hypothetical protein GUITHDRAFT_87086 [Guillardia theta CCMP2712]|uniref:Aminotransferase class V domain-containing protein n=1 Tax=Guillardia theta (strain CCMP2712) TaxID=905079 RepID=L1JBL1_GUITC|nr:hypothetical protein GUITHDRAFT_87086 [Guillardia theta CCMP2712]EKX45509.1 hypothetical protein GUITHDRAFT_87086 [Guillardia theta CCMP2712]|eukprot:XP_005832489.1 hypothetical protein GUITHDRAFT_87086 [Guillardia theta CCMP2712]